MKMNDIRSRIQWLEEQLECEREPAPCIPGEWLRIDPETGRPVGPPADASPAELEGYAELLAMDESVVGPYPGEWGD